MTSAFNFPVKSVLAYVHRALAQFMLMAIILTQAYGQENTPLPDVSPGQKTVRLSQYTTLPSPIRLTDVSSDIALFIPVSAAVEVKDAVVDVHFTHSIALQGARSYLAVRLNEATLAQIPLDPAQSVASASIRLPAELWRGGYNKLTIAVVQHYTNRCEDPEAPELWTEIDLLKSALTYSTSPVAKVPALSDLSGLLSPGLGGFERALLLTSPDNSDQILRSQALPLVAQALALRRLFAPFFVDHERWRAPQPDTSPADTVAGQAPYLPMNSHPEFHVLVGTLSQLSSILPVQAIEGIKGPQLLIDRAGNGMRLIVTGPTPVDVIAAARALSEIDDVVNPSPGISILSREVNDAHHPPMDRNVIRSGALYTFKALGSDSALLAGIGSRKMAVQLPVPANYYTIEGAKAEMLVDFGYGAGMGPGSVMNVLLNGEYIHGLLLDNPNGAAFQSYRISLPARRLRPGRNNVEFDFNLRPQMGGGDCSQVKGRHLMAQILGTSTFEMPQGGAEAIQPNLALFTDTSFPYATPSVQEPKILRITDEAMLGSALTVIGKLAQVSQARLDGWLIAVGRDFHDKGNTIILATPELLPPDLFASWSMALGRTSKWTYRSLNDMRETKTELSDGLLEHLFQDNAQQKPDLLRGSITQTGSLGSLGVMAAFRNPFDAQATTITLITASDNDILRARIDELVQGEIWNQIAGHLAVWKGLTGTVTTMQVADNFEVGSNDRWLLIRLILSQNPWYWLSAVLGVILVAVVSARILLVRRRRKLEHDV